MIISLIVAMDEDRAIGVNNRIPWHLPDDLKRFKTLTMEGRTKVVITNQQDYKPDDCLVVHSVDEAIDLVYNRGETEVFIIGGGEIFKQSLDFSDRIYLSTVHTVVHAGVYFPQLDEFQWTEMASSYHPVDQNHQYPFTFTTLMRKTEN